MQDIRILGIPDILPFVRIKEWYPIHMDGHIYFKAKTDKNTDFNMMFSDTLEIKGSITGTHMRGIIRDGRLKITWADDMFV